MSEHEHPPIRKHKKLLTIVGTAVSAVVITIILLSVIFITSGFNLTYRNIKYYDKVRVENSFMPQTESLGNYKDTDFKYNIRIAPFGSESATLKVKYKSKEYKQLVYGLKRIGHHEHHREQRHQRKRKQEYEQEKEKVYANYTASYFPVKDVTAQDDNTIELDGYKFSYIDQGNYPKKLFFVATNDNKKTITYICFTDPDLDYIDSSFEEFLKHNCKW